MKEELVSIITPMYKGAAFIGETIRSVQAQPYSDWEMIIVDDCSPDGRSEIQIVRISIYSLVFSFLCHRLLG